jgi:methyl-accepting chemotaxis protein
VAPYPPTMSTGLILNPGGNYMRRGSLADLPLIVKMGVAPIVALITLVMLAGGTVVVQTKLANNMQSVVEQELPQSVRMQKIAERISNVHGRLYMLLTNKAAAVEEDKIPGQMEDLLKEIDGINADVLVAKNTAPESQKKSFDELSKNLKDTRSSVDAVGAILAADFTTAAGFVAPFEDQYKSMSVLVGKLVSDAETNARAQGKATYQMAKTSQLLIMVASAGTLLVVLAITMASILPLRRAIMRIAGATEKLAQGDTSVDLEAIQRGDELGAIVRSLMVFREQEEKLQEMRANQDAAAAMTEDERRKADQIRESAARVQAQVVDAVAGGLAKLAEGDLTFRMRDLPEEYRKVQDDYNAALEELQSAMTVISSNAQGMQGGAGEISQAADDLSKRTEQQAATLEETAAALDEITATVRKTAEGAIQANAVVAGAKSDAEKSGLVVREAVSAMSAIEQSSQKIGQIIGVIDEIAFQTNLLALNAGVEAARAGDAGKGFAVVAQEVRGLAQRSAEAAKEIKGLISASTQQVGQGVSLVGQTGEALGRIVEKVNDISGLVSEISASAQEQAVGLNQVNTAVNQMDQVTQQNAAMVEQSTAASHHLVQEAGELVRLVSHFKTGKQAEAGGSYRTAERSRTAPRAADTRSKYASAVAMKPTSQTRSAPEPQDDSWEEF